MSTLTAFSLAYAVSAAISLFAALAVFRRGNVRGGRALGLLLLAASLWALCDAIELHLTTADAKRLVSQIQYLGVVSCAPFFFHASMELSRLESKLTPPVLVAVWGVPVVTLLVAWTSAWHTWLWTGIDLPTAATAPFATYHYGPWFWVLAAQHYGLTLANTVILVWARRHVARAFRASMMAVIVALLISWIGNALYIFKLGPFPGLNYLTLSLGLSGAFLAWAVVSEGLLDLLPRAREALLESLTDGVLILDTTDRIIYSNSSARDQIGLQPGVTAVPEAIAMPQHHESLLPWLSEVAVPHGAATKWLEVRVDPVLDRWGDVAGRLVVTRNVTVRKVLEQERERLIKELKSALREVRALEELLPICANCKKVRDDNGYWSQIDVYLRNRAAVEFTHGICPDCEAAFYRQMKDKTPD